MTKRLVHLLVALGLVASALAGLAAPAAAGPEAADNAIFFPWVANGEDLDGDGPWYGTITVQNLEDFAINISIWAAGDYSSPITTAGLNAHAAKTFSAASLGLAEPGQGVVVTAEWAGNVEDQLIDAGLCPTTFTSEQRTVSIIHGDQNTADSVEVELAAGETIVADSVTVTTVNPNTDQPYVKGTDYTASVTDSTITIDWSLVAAEPTTGSAYTVSYIVTSAEAACPAPRIGGVEKHVMPVAAPNARTGEDQVAVSGYTALPMADLLTAQGLALDTSFEDLVVALNQANWAFPIVQTNNGWDSILHLTNVSELNNCGVTVIFYESPSSSSDPSTGSFTETLDAGETWTLDLLNNLNFPTGVNNWVGQAWISADCAIAPNVDRVKNQTMMALTNVAQPRIDEGPSTVYAPLVFEDFNGWNTGINIANLSDSQSNTVTINFYNQAGQLVATDTRVLGPRAMEFVYRPATADVGTGGLTGDLRQAVISGTAPLAAAVDEVKYIGERVQGQGQAMSYLAQVGADAGQTLSVALVQKGTSLQPDGTLAGDTSGINLFNGNAIDPSLVAVRFFDQTGAAVAPTLGGPVVLDIPPYGGATLYTPFYAEMPAGFQGSALARVVDGGPVSGISNNVNYAVEGDGSAVYNLHVATPLQEGVSELTLEPADATNAVNTDHTVTATFTQDGAPVEGAVVFFTVGGANTASGVAITDADGEASFTYTGTTAGADTITACADVNASGTCDAGDLTATATKTWVDWAIELNPQADQNAVGTDHTVIAMVTDNVTGNPVSGATVLFEVTGANTASGSGLTGNDGLASFTYTGTKAGFDVITACVDVNENGDCDAGEPTATAAKVWVIAEGGLALNPTSTVAENVGDGMADTTATVTVTNTTDPVPVVLVITDNDPTVDGGFAACAANIDVDDDTSGTTTGGLTNTFSAPIWACDGGAGSSFTVTAYHDVNNNGVFDSGVDAQIGSPQTFSIT